MTLLNDFPRISHRYLLHISQKGVLLPCLGMTGMYEHR